MDRLFPVIINNYSKPFLFHVITGEFTAAVPADAAPVKYHAITRRKCDQYKI
jgi:hypothetical protein